MAWEPDYASLADLKSYLRSTVTGDDAELGLAITAASRAVDGVCDRQFGKTDTVQQRTYEVEWDRTRGLYRAGIDDVMTLAGLVVTVNGTPTTDYLLEPTNAASVARPWEALYTTSATDPTLGSGPRTILVDATFGWSAVPDTIKQATLLQMSRFFADRNAPFGVAGSPDLGSEMRLLNKVHPDVELMLRNGRYVRGVGFA